MYIPIFLIIVVVAKDTIDEFLYASIGIVDPYLDITPSSND
jgi:hypothetical protein